MLDPARSRLAAIITVLLLGACKAPAPPPAAAVAPPAAAKTTTAPTSAAAAARAQQHPPYEPVSPLPVVSVYMRPALSQPPPIAVGWAPPPLLVDSPGQQRSSNTVWVGGYWTWQGNWIWAHGHWIAPPRTNYTWVQPYYEHRNGAVIFIDGHWAAPGVVFVPPAPGLHLPIEPAGPRVIAGPRPEGPEAVFVPPPPGSRPGITVPAPIGTAPAVVTGAPPVVAVGMRVSVDGNSRGLNLPNSPARRRGVSNITNVPNVSKLIIVAPAGVTASGKAVNVVVPEQADRAAALAPAVKTAAPAPTSDKLFATFLHGHPLPTLPAPQVVMMESAAHPRAVRVQAQLGAQDAKRVNGGAPQAATPPHVVTPSKQPPAAGKNTAPSQ